MNHSVNIENYESFYLDFIEGNLGEAETAALMDFLDKNPDLIVDEDALAYLPAADFISLDSELKADLKFPDTAQKIGINNIDTFLIASVEKQLPVNKLAELDQFLENHPLYYNELSLYQRSRLQADLGITFPTKNALKKGGIIVPMYVRFAAIAACAVIAFTIYNSGNEQSPNLALGGKVVKHGLKIKSAKTENEQSNLVEEKFVNGTSNSDRYVASNNNFAEKAIESKEFTAEKSNNVDRLNFKKSKSFPANLPVLAESNNSSQQVIANLESTNQTEMAAVAMKNPIVPITNRISELINKQVDFQTSKAAQKKGGGFYLKIGKFELSRKIYDKKN